MLPERDSRQYFAVEESVSCEENAGRQLLLMLWLLGQCRLLWQTAQAQTLWLRERSTQLTPAPLQRLGVRTCSPLN